MVFTYGSDMPVRSDTSSMDIPDLYSSTALAFSSSVNFLLAILAIKVSYVRSPLANELVDTDSDVAGLNLGALDLVPVLVAGVDVVHDDFLVLGEH